MCIKSLEHKVLKNDVRNMYQQKEFVAKLQNSGSKPEMVSEWNGFEMENKTKQKKQTPNQKQTNKQT